MRIKKLNTYALNEERVNVVSHFIGLILSVLALVFLMVKAVRFGQTITIVSAIIYGVSLIVLYTASTLYHNSVKDRLRKRLNVFDHASIFVLIAGSYTPYLLIALKDTFGFQFFIFIWIVAIIGVILKLFFFGKYEILSTIMYVAMGWVVVFIMKSLMANISIYGIYWLWIGGILYTIGAVIYSINKIKMNHAVFHIFVLLGSISHFISIYFYVLPNKI